MLNVTRLEIARKRRRLTSKALAEKAGIGSVTLSRIVKGKQIPDESTEQKIIAALDYPREFFERDDLDLIEANTASFRSMSSMTAREREAALSAGSLAYEILSWLEAHYDLPEPDLLDLGHENSNAASAARMLRQYWAIGEKPIGNVVKLLEAKGVRVFSLSENTKNVDAFSLWRNGEPFIFLNTFKTAERSRFDAAHELGHLVLHRHGGPVHREAEQEANQFASSFLMPSADIRSHISYVTSLDQVIRAKTRWGVSAAALCYRLHKLKILSDWQYRSFCIQINQRFKNSEPKPLGRETSSIWRMVFQDLWRSGIAPNSISKSLSIPDEELQSLIYGLTGEALSKPSQELGRSPLRVVK